MEQTLTIYRSGVSYFPKRLRGLGYAGHVEMREGYKNLVLVQPGTELSELRKGLAKAIANVDFEIKVQDLLGQQEESLES